MNRRTFVKMAAGTAMLGAASPAAAAPDHGKPRPWPQTAYLDNPIANGLIPLQFVETLPLLVRARADFYSFVKDAELFSFTAHEWMTDAVLFRGMEIKPRNPSDLVNQEIKDIKLSLHVDGCKVADGFTVGDFMREGGRAFRRWDRSDATKILYTTFLGWADKDGSDGGFLGYFLPDKTRISVLAGSFQGSSLAVEIQCDLARYTSKK